MQCLSNSEGKEGRYHVYHEGLSKFIRGLKKSTDEDKIKQTKYQKSHTKGE